MNQLPHSLDAERSVLSACMRDPALVHEVAELVDGAWYLEEHRVLWSGLQALMDAAQPVTPITLAEWLHAQATLGLCGGAAYIGDLMDFVGTTVGVRAHATVVRDLARLRRIVHASDEAVADGCSDEARGDVDGYADRTLARLLEATQTGRVDQSASLADVMRAAGREIDRRSRLSGPVGLSTGFRDLDERILGLEGGDLVVVGGLSSQGKTTFVHHVAVAAARAGKPVDFFSLEMPKMQLGLRLYAFEGHLPLRKVRSGRGLSVVEWDTLVATERRTSPWPLHIDDTGGLSISQIRSRARRRAAQRGTALIVVDYLQIIAPTTPGRSREEEVSDCTRGLKALAKELNVPVIAVSALNREGSKGPRRPPVMADFKGSSSIEYDADLLFGIYRPGKEGDAGDDCVETHVLKQRNGPTGRVKMRWIPDEVRLEDWPVGEDEREEAA